MMGRAGYLNITAVNANAIPQIAQCARRGSRNASTETHTVAAEKPYTAGSGMAKMPCSTMIGARAKINPALTQPTQ